MMHDSPYDVRFAQSAPRRILLVEDVSIMRFYVRTALERAGIDVIEAASLQEARRALCQEPHPTSIILDLDLPDGDGLDLLPELPPRLPVMALTADDSPETATRCRTAGCSRVIYKGELIGGIKKLVQLLEQSEPTSAGPTGPDGELRERYLEYLLEADRNLRQAYMHGDLASIRRLAHRLRGTAVHFGHPEIGTSAKAVSTALASGSLDQLGRACHTLASQLQQAASARSLETGPQEPRSHMPERAFGH